MTDVQTIMMAYADLTDEQKLRGCWAAFCDADPVPVEFPDEMEAAGYIEWGTATQEEAEDGFAWERGIEADGPIWRLTDAGRAVLARQI